MSKLMTGAGETELMRENNWTERYSPCEKIMAQIPLRVSWKDYLMALSHLKVVAPKLTVFVALPIIHRVVFQLTVLQKCHRDFARSHNSTCCGLYPSECWVRVRVRWRDEEAPVYIFENHFATVELHPQWLKFEVEQLLVRRPNQRRASPHHCNPSDNIWILLLIYATCQELGGRLFSWGPHYSSWTFTRHQ